MSDCSLPPASSPSSSGAARHKTSPHVALAFLVHSPNSIANHLPPDVDNRPLARQKRRRTSKEDEEILKAEYLRNPKPDKAARLEIVAKVALGEKEVQIWFQNKRQNDRRRSRPLDSSSGEFMSDSSLMSDPASEVGSVVPEKENVDEQGKETSKPDETTQAEEEKDAETEQSDRTSKPTTEAATAIITETQSTVASTIVTTADTLASIEGPTQATAPTEPSDSQQDVPSSQEAARKSWISNRRSASFRYTADYEPETATFPSSSQPETEAPPPVRKMQRKHSFVRLSMADDGTARVITDADKTPSPLQTKMDPTTFARAAAGFRRSYSAAGLGDRLSAASQGEPARKIRRTASTIGRSRDSRAWEFWCDAEARNNTSLTARAHQEETGSAADAIGLLRASRRILSQNQMRQNTPLLSRGESARVAGSGMKKTRGPLQRASTSSGRLQTKASKKGDGSESDELPQTESDKENWEPELPKSNRPRQQRESLAPKRPRQVLRENMEIMSQSNSLGAMMARERRKGGSSYRREPSDPEQDDELRDFMGGEVNSAEEQGCVEGLLKLSQGNWR